MTSYSNPIRLGSPSSHSSMNDECATKTAAAADRQPLMDIEQLKEQCLKGTVAETGSQRQSRNKLREKQKLSSSSLNKAFSLGVLMI